MKPTLIESQERSGVRILTLQRGRGNSLDPSLLAALRGHFAGQPAEPTVLTARGASFCTGLDLQYCLSQDRPGMRALMEDLHRTLTAIFAYPAPVVGALSGRTLAGGALLALCCDLRWMAAGAGPFGIHGAQLGISYPHVAVELVRSQYGRVDVDDVLYQGPLLSAEMALDRGRIDAVMKQDELVPKAVERAARLGSPAFVANKRALRAPVLTRLERLGAAPDEAWLDQWYRPKTQSRIEAALHANPKDRS